MITANKTCFHRLQKIVNPSFNTILKYHLCIEGVTDLQSEAGSEEIPSWHDLKWSCSVEWLDSIPYIWKAQ